MLKTCSTNLAKWRIGTIVKVTRVLSSLFECLDTLFDPVDFRVKDTSELGQTSEAIRRVELRFENQPVLIISGANESLRGWFRGCLCHGAECKEFAKKHMPFTCPNNAKGRIGPGLADKLEACFIEWETLPHKQPVEVLGGSSYQSNLVTFFIRP